MALLWTELLEEAIWLLRLEESILRCTNQMVRSLISHKHNSFQVTIKAPYRRRWTRAKYLAIIKIRKTISRLDPFFSAYIAFNDSSSTA